MSDLAKDSSTDDVTKRNISKTPIEWRLSDDDARFLELLGTLPKRFFDIHMHVGCPDHVDPLPSFLDDPPKLFDLETWSDCLGTILGTERLSGALLTPYPSQKGDVGKANQFVIDSLSSPLKGLFRTTFLVSPHSNRCEVESLIETNKKVVGFKPYHLLARGSSTFESDIDEFIPEWSWKLADELGLLFILHLVKKHALSDKDNLRYIIEHCSKYPNAKLILAHAARGFNPNNTLKALPKLTGLNNVWFDSSAICESEALAAIIEHFGCEKLMWGSDFPISFIRGRCVSIGTGFAWITTTDNPSLTGEVLCGNPVQVGLESLRALLNACGMKPLSLDETDRIFHSNASSLLQSCNAE